MKNRYDNDRNEFVQIVSINGVDYDVEEVDPDKMGADPDETVYGSCNHEQTKILVMNTLSAEGKKHTLRHEVGHGSAAESGASHIMAQYVGEKAEELEELLIRVWLPVYLQALGDLE